MWSQEFGEQNQEDFRLRFPSNSKATEHGKKCDVSRPCWIGIGLIIGVDGKGRRLPRIEREELRCLNGNHGLGRFCARASLVWALTSWQPSCQLVSQP